MPPKSPEPLTRGKACLPCRRRKTRCDGARPVCTPCAKAGRNADCEYEEKKIKTRTQILQEKIASLEERLRELEPDDLEISQSPSPFVLSPVDATSQFSSVHSSPVSPGAGPSTDGRSRSSVSNVSGGQLGLRSNSPKGSSDSSHNPSPSPKMNNLIPTETKIVLLEIFYAHQHQCMFDVRPSKFQACLAENASQDGPFRALANAVFLLACNFARSPQFTGLEANFLAHALEAITTSLNCTDRLIDIIQASCLVAAYFYSNSRISEAYCHAVTAAKLAFGLGLHQICYPWNSGGVHAGISTTPPQSPSELTDRIATFWQVYWVDRTWSAALGLPSAFPDGSDAASSKVTTPLPASSANLYGSEVLNENAFNVLYGPHVRAILPSTSCLRVQACHMYERAHRLAAVRPELRQPVYWDDYRSISDAVDHLVNVLPPFAGRDCDRQQAPYVDVTLLLIHTMVFVTQMFLQKDFVDVSVDACSKTDEAGTGMIQLARSLGIDDYPFLDPVICGCWAFAAKMYLAIMSHTDAHVNGSCAMHDAIQLKVKQLVQLMQWLGAALPFAKHQSQHIEQGLATAHERFLLSAGLTGPL